MPDWMLTDAEMTEAIMLRHTAERDNYNFEDAICKAQARKIAEEIRKNITGGDEINYFIDKKWWQQFRDDCVLKGESDGR